MGNELSVTKHVEQPAAPVATDSIRKPNEKWDTKCEPIGSSDVMHFRNLVEGKSGKGKFQNEAKTATSGKWNTGTNRLSDDALKDQTKTASTGDFLVFGEEGSEILPDALWPNEGLATIEKREGLTELASAVPGNRGAVKGEGELEVILDGKIPVFNEEELMGSTALPTGSRLNEGPISITRKRDSTESLPVTSEGTGVAKGRPEAASLEEIPVFDEGEPTGGEVLSAVLPDEARRRERAVVDLRETSVPGERALESAEEVVPVLLRDDIPGPRMAQESVGYVAVSPGEQVLGQVGRISDPVPVTQVSAQQTIVEIGNVVAQRILVHEASGAKAEVLVQLRETVLPGTEIALLKEGTSLRVDFFSRVGESAVFLSQHHGALREYLTQRLESIKDVKVNVYDHSEGRSGDAFGQGQSRRHQRERSSDEEYLG